MSFLFFFSLQSGGEKVRETMGSVLDWGYIIN